MPGGGDTSKTGKDATGKGSGKATTKPAPIGPLPVTTQTPATSLFTNPLTPVRSATSSQSSQATSSSTSSPTTTADSQSNSSSNLSAITGGLVGGIFVLIGIILLLWFARQGRKRALYRQTTKASWSPSPSTTTLYHRPPNLRPSMQSVRAMYPVTESPFEEQYGQEPHLQPPKRPFTQQGY